MPDGVWVTLDVLFPNRLTALSVQATRLVCFVGFPQDVECTGVAPFTGGSAQITVEAGPGDDITDTTKSTM